MGPGTTKRRLWKACVLSALLWPRIWGQGALEALPVRFDVEFFDPADIEAAAASGAPCDLDLCGEAHRVLVEPVDLRSYRFRATTRSGGERRIVYKSPPKTFKGTLVGDSESVVRLSITKSGLRGYVRSGENWTFIRPMPPSVALSEGEHLVFTDADLGDRVVGTCAAVRPLTDGALLTEPVSSPSPSVAAAELGVLELAVDADFEYFSRYGTDSVTEIESVLNEVDGIFGSDLGLRIELVHINVWEDPSDPYESTDPDVLLDELRSYWTTNMGSVNRDAVHLITGKDLDNLTVGLAFLDAVCRSFAYGLTQDLNPASLVPLVVAHELGHNLGAEHDPDGSTPRYIMYPSISGTNLSEYSPESQSQISSYLATVSCVEAGSGSGSTPPPGGGGGGGGGGPVDPLLLLVLAAALTYRRARAHERG